jgi:hypothetical protein
MSVFGERSVYILGLLLSLGVAAPVLGQTPTQPASCSSSHYRQFDFWIGEWEVRTPDGNLAGTNRIEKIEGQCVLQENWQGARGGTGRSFNIYDLTTGGWHQTWVSNDGMLLLLDGGLEGGKMVLSGTRVGQGGATVHHRITWEPLAADTVRQLWEQSPDGGESWSVVFDGRYFKR